MYDATDKEDHSSYISGRTRSSLASSERQSFVSKKTVKGKIPDVEDIAFPGKKNTSSRAPLKKGPKREEARKIVKKGNSRSARIQKERKSAQSPQNKEVASNEVKAPNCWAEVYGTMKEMRTSGVSRNAAVDTMGCERITNADASPRDKRYHILTSLMLSSQTKDTANALAMNRLYNELPAHAEGKPAGLNLENILAVDAKVLNQLIWGVGFHNNKTKYIKAVAEILRDQWNSDIPDTIDGLVSLPGVGPKMAYLCLSAAWGRTEGIGVDVHVHRITNLWGWHKTKTPEETRIALQAWLPKELWHEINWLLVGFGQTTCLPIGKKCGECDLGLRGLCKAADKIKVARGREMVKVKTELLHERLSIESLKTNVKDFSTSGKHFSPKLEDKTLVKLKTEDDEP